MKTALDIYNTSDRFVIQAYYEALTQMGTKGKLAMLLLRAQRTQARYQRAAENPPPDGQYLKLVMNRNEYAIAELVKFCQLHLSDPKLRITLHDYKYGIRIVIRRHAALRFRAKSGTAGKWTGDEKNLAPICAYCDELMREEYGTTGRLFGGQTPEC